MFNKILSQETSASAMSGQEQCQTCRVEWAFGAFMVVMLCLFAWAYFTTKQEISRKIQPYVD